MASRYLIYVALNFLVVFASLFSLVLYTDPTALLSIAGYKATWGCVPGMRSNLYISKPSALALHDYESVIVGTSRVLSGIKIKSLSAVTMSNNVFNAGTPGLDNKHLQLYLDILDHDKNLKNLAIGLDLGMFIRHRPVKNTGDMIEYLARQRASIPEYDVLIRSHLNRETLINTFSTLLDQRECHDPEITRRGDTTAWHDARRVIRSGYLRLAEKTKQDERSRNSIPASSSLRDDKFKSISDEVETFGSRLEHMCQAGVSVKIFTNPVHADIISMLDELLPGAATTYKRSLLNMVTGRKLAGCDIELWDFAVIHPYTITAFPDNNDPDDPSTLFWEPSHYKHALGDIILRRMWDDSTDNFGTRLTTDNLDQHLATQNRLLNEYRQRQAR